VISGWRSAQAGTGYRGPSRLPAYQRRRAWSGRVPWPPAG